MLTTPVRQDRMLSPLRTVDGKTVYGFLDHHLHRQQLQPQLQPHRQPHRQSPKQALVQFLWQVLLRMAGEAIPSSREVDLVHKAGDGKAVIQMGLPMMEVG
jgi:hypothetical protein